LQKGDVIVKLNGQAISDYTALRLQISQMAPGTSVKLEVWRDGKTQDYTVTLGELPEKAEAEESSGTESSGGLEGVEVDELTPEIAQQLNLGPGTHGVVVTAVDPSSPAAGAQPPIGRGDVIQEINHKPIRNLSDYRQAVAAAGNQPLLLLVNHGGVTGYSVVQPH
jgi:serine protease Do